MEEALAKGSAMSASFRAKALVRRGHDGRRSSRPPHGRAADRESLAFPGTGRQTRAALALSGTLAS